MKIIVSLAACLSVTGAAFAVTPIDLLFSKPVVAHINVVQELKEKFDFNRSAIPKKRATKVPTVEHMKAVENGGVTPMWAAYGEDYYKKLLNDFYKAQYKQLIDTVVEREYQFCNDYYVFYHGQSKAFRVLQDFLKELYAFINITAPYNRFEFLRISHLAASTFNQNSFIDAHEGADLGFVHWNDTSSEMIKNMICVNLALFGNLSFQSEQTFSYFKFSSSLAGLWVLDSITNQLFTDFGFNPAYIVKLKELAKQVDTAEGNLFQIFVPKNKVDQYVYLSHDYGTPYRAVIEPSVYDYAKQRHTKISSVLDQYIKDPMSIPNFDLMQARMLMSQDGILNPNSGVKIFRYITASDENILKYRKSVKDLAFTVFSDALKNKTFKNTQNTRFNTLLSYIETK